MFRAMLRAEPDAAEAVEEIGRRNLVLEHDGLPVPPMRFRNMVRKHALWAEEFISEGMQVKEALTAILRANGVDSLSGLDVYDFGSGCGRVARHFINAGQRSFTGSDVDQELIDWCNAELVPRWRTRPVEFFRNDYAPPIPKPDASFDLIYVISVLTHMNEQNQVAWSHELCRLLRPGGVLLISFHEREPFSGVKVVERVDREQRKWLGIGGAPAVYYSTSNSVRYLTNLFAPVLDFVALRSKAIRNHQSLMMLRKPPRQSTEDCEEPAFVEVW